MLINDFMLLSCVRINDDDDDDDDDFTGAVTAARWRQLLLLDATSRGKIVK